MTQEELREYVDSMPPAKKLSALEPSFFWAPLLRVSITENALINDTLHIPKKTCFIFAGPAGNGRHTTAEALAGSLCLKGSEQKRHILRRTGWELDEEDPAEVRSFVENVIRLTKEYGSMCLMLDAPENCRHNLLMQEYLAYLLDLTGLELYVIIITKELSMVHPAFQNQGWLCYCAAPDRETRKYWLANRLNDPVKLSMDGMDLKTLVDKTDGFSWKQLDDLLMYMRIELYNQIMVLREKTPEKIKNPKKAIEEGMIKLPLGALQHLIDHVGHTHSAEGVFYQPQAIAALPLFNPVSLENEQHTQEHFNTQDNEDIQKKAHKHEKPENLSADELLDVMNF